MFRYLALSCLLAIDAADISENCLKCICQVEGCESQIGKCRPDSGSPSCGPFQIKEPYWIDCGRPGEDWKSCTTQMECSRTCVKKYMQLFGNRCAGLRTPTCQDYARIHNGGPFGCKSRTTISYWMKVHKCCASSAGGCGFDFDGMRYQAADIDDDNVDRMAEDA